MFHRGGIFFNFYFALFSNRPSRNGGSILHLCKLINIYQPISNSGTPGTGIRKGEGPGEAVPTDGNPPRRGIDGEGKQGEAREGPGVMHDWDFP